MFRPEVSGVQIFLDILTGCQHTVFIAHGFPAVRIAPEDFLVTAAAYPVHIVNMPVFNILIGFLTASGVDKKRVVSQRDFEIIGPRGADTAERPGLVDFLIERD